MFSYLSSYLLLLCYVNFFDTYFCNNLLLNSKQRLEVAHARVRMFFSFLLLYPFITF